MRQATYLLKEERDRQFAIRAVTNAPLGMEVVVKNPTRTPAQNRRLFSMLSAIEKSGKELGGREWAIEDWYDILWSAFLREKKMETGTMVVGIHDEFLVLGRFRPSKLDREKFGEFMESVSAYMAHNGIHWDEKAPVDEAYERFM